MTSAVGWLSGALVKVQVMASSTSRSMSTCPTPTMVVPPSGSLQTMLCTLQPAAAISRTRYAPVSTPAKSREALPGTFSVNAPRSPVKSNEPLPVVVCLTMVMPPAGGWKGSGRPRSMLSMPYAPKRWSAPSQYSVKVQAVIGPLVCGAHTAMSFSSIVSPPSVRGTRGVR